MAAERRHKQSQALGMTVLRFLRASSWIKIIFFDAGRNSDAGGDDINNLFFMGLSD